MARKPSERRNYKEEDMELNLTPMMNLISILIPVLLLSSVFVEIAVLNVTAPAIGSAAAADKPPEKPDRPPLNLTVTITDQGYTVAASGAVLPGPGGEKGPTYPVKQSTVACQRYVGTWPPPRARNRELPKCERSEQSLQFWVYDNEALTKTLVEIKEAFPDENRIILAAEPAIQYEAITDAMDASREGKDPGGDKRALFEEVVLSPGLS